MKEVITIFVIIGLTVGFYTLGAEIWEALAIACILSFLTILIALNN